MAVRAIKAFFFEPEASKCYASCKNRDYHELIVTKCNHVFCKACIDPWIKLQVKGKNCPTCNVEEEKKDYTHFKDHLDRFTYYIQNDFSTLKEKLSAEKITHRITKGQLLKESFTKKKLDESENENCCQICHEVPFQVYFIVKDKDFSRVGRHMHEGCWTKMNIDECEILDIEVHELVKVSKKLQESEKSTTPLPFKPPSPFIVVLLFIIFPISIWAFAMNSRVYQNQSAVLFVLSIPSLVIVKISSLLFSGIKSIFASKKTQQ